MDKRAGDADGSKDQQSSDESDNSSGSSEPERPADGKHYLDNGPNGKLRDDPVLELEQNFNNEEEI